MLAVGAPSFPSFLIICGEREPGSLFVSEGNDTCDRNPGISAAILCKLPFRYSEPPCSANAPRIGLATL